MLQDAGISGSNVSGMMQAILCRVRQRDDQVNGGENREHGTRYKNDVAATTRSSFRPLSFPTNMTTKNVAMRRSGKIKGHPLLVKNSLRSKALRQTKCCANDPSVPPISPTWRSYLISRSVSFQRLPCDQLVKLGRAVYNASITSRRTGNP